MKLNELRHLIETSVTNQKLANGRTSNLSTYFKACDDLQENKKVLGELAREGKLDVDLKVLEELLEQYFKSKNQEQYYIASNRKYIKVNITYSQYTDEADTHPYEDDEICVHDANAVGVITLISKVNGKILKEFYEVFDTKASLVGKNASTIKFDKKLGIYYIEDFQTVNILDLVPNAKTSYGQRSNLLLAHAPTRDIIDIFYQALEITQRNKLKQTRRFITDMIKNEGLDISKPNYVTGALDLMKEQEQTGFEY